MREEAWLKQVLADAKDEREHWPEWAKVADVQTSLNSHQLASTIPSSTMPDPRDQAPISAAAGTGQSELGLK